MTAGLLVVESRIAFEPPPAGAHELQGLVGAPDRDAELLGRAQLAAARLAHDREGRAEARAALWTAGAKVSAALRAFRRQLVLERLEVALREPAIDAERHPVPERLAAFFLEPVPGATHAVDCT